MEHRKALVAVPGVLLATDAVTADHAFMGLAVEVFHQSCLQIIGCICFHVVIVVMRQSVGGVLLLFCFG
jgi:hypothetical protein